MPVPMPMLYCNQTAQMRVTVRYFASVRETTGRAAEEREVPDGSTVDAVWQQLIAQHPRLAGLRVRPAVNQEYVHGELVLGDGDEVVFVPPVSGGGR